MACLVACNAAIGDGPQDGVVPPNVEEDAGIPVDVGFAPSNIAAADLVAGTAPLVLDSPDLALLVDTDQGTITDIDGDGDFVPAGVVFRTAAQGGGPSLGVFSSTSLVVTDGTQVIVTGQNALVFAVGGTAEISGTLVAVGGRGSPDAGGPGGARGGTAASRNGGGDGGGIGGPERANEDDDAGGGGGGYLDAGGNGGARAGVAGGLGGQPSGSEILIPLVGGSGGGFGGNPNNGDPGRGGGGGGAVQISALESITIGDGAGINCGGGGGEGSAVDDGGGGGGSGGAILLEAPSVRVEGILAVNGGGGGAGGNGGDRGANGQPGGLSAQAATGGVGVGEGRSGGAGGAGAVTAGAAGQDSAGNQGEDDNAGGGGGAGGRIFAHSDAFTANGVITPEAALTSGSLTQ